MRSITYFLIIIFLIFGCGNESTEPEPVNNAPTISGISANPNPVPKNRTTTLSVTADDIDGHQLSYQWTAPAGTFPQGSTSAQVTWIPPETEASYTIDVTVSDGLASADTSIDVTVEGAIYNISGQITNQAGQPATSLYVVITDSDSQTDSVLTDGSGNYSFSNIPEGAISMSLRSNQIIVHTLPRYIEKDTTFSLSDDLVLNMGIREFNTIFHDDGTQASQWNMYGGVRNDGTKYIFEDYFLQSDYMVMVSPKPVPSNANIQATGFLLRGEAAPSGSSQIFTEILVNGNNQQLVWTATYYTSPTYYWGSLEQISGLPGNNIQLYLEFNELDAIFVYITDIWIYNY